MGEGGEPVLGLLQLQRRRGRLHPSQGTRDDLLRLRDLRGGDRRHLARERSRRDADGERPRHREAFPFGSQVERRRIELNVLRASRRTFAVFIGTRTLLTVLEYAV